MNYYKLLYIIIIVISSIVICYIVNIFYTNSIMNTYYKKSIYKAPYKILAIGDLHGDYKATIAVLKKGKIINKKKNWIAGKTHVVQLGDILDRKPRSINNSDEDSELKIFNLFMKLQKQAFKAGGAFHCIMGNHELMNIMGEFSYVSPMGMKHFDNPNNRKNFFKPGSKIAKKFANRWNVIIKIGKYIFVHGGLNKEISQNYKIPFINKIMSSYLNGNIKLEKSNKFNKLFLDHDSLMWNREFSGNLVNCEKLQKILNYKKAKSIIVGHTPQKEGINDKCGLIWRIDTGMSRAFGHFNNDKLQILKIINNGKKINIIK